jgi:ABC-2 type transport system permease protein
MTTFFGLILKDFLELRRDRLAMALTVLLPLLALLLFGYGIRLGSRNIPLVIFDSDHTVLSRAFADTLIASNVFAIKYAQDNQTPRSFLDRGFSALVLPAGFARDLETVHKAAVNFFIDGTELNQARATQIYCRSICQIFQLPGARPSPKSYYVIPKVTVWFNPSLHEDLFIVPGTFAVILWMFPSLLAAVAMARELEQGSVTQAYVAKVPAHQFVSAKLVVYLTVGLIQTVMLILLGSWLFGLHIVGDWFWFCLCTVVYVATSVSAGLFIGAFTGSQTIAVQTTSTGGFFPCLLLSGFVYPLENIPPAIRIVSYVVPTRYYIEASREAFMRASGWQLYAGATGILMIFVCVFLGASWWKLRAMQLQE